MNKTIPLVYLKVLLGILAVALVALLFFLGLNYRSARLEIGVARRSAPQTRIEAANIESLMTFDYINKVFKLPPDYLKERLAIADVRYPRLSLRAYIRAGHLDNAWFIAQTIDAVRSYSAAKNSF
jgi:hypothetical protein